jgi:hypothetical protein
MRALGQRATAGMTRSPSVRWLTYLGDNDVFGIDKEHIMHPKFIVTGFVLSSIVLATAPTQAQVSVDVSKITCDQYVHAKIATPLYLAAWLSGYYNAKRNNLMVDLQTLEENATKVQNYCYDEKNFKVPVMKAVERVLGGRK